ncbi:MAG: hypothetical protein DI537_23780 [Stutzerimonas stutzeri]|nr:MAG: hypothetical protein DI537_23780 [Stutzerimonas stutzeri]
MKITNIEKGPRGLNTKDGAILVEPGQTVDAELSAAEEKVARGTGWFEFGKADKAKPAGAKYEARAEGDAFAIFEGDKKVGDLKTQADADTFNALSDEEKSKLVKKG